MCVVRGRTWVELRAVLLAALAWGLLQLVLAWVWGLLLPLPVRLLLPPALPPLAPWAGRS